MRDEECRMRGEIGCTREKGRGRKEGGGRRFIIRGERRMGERDRDERETVHYCKCIKSM